MEEKTTIKSNGNKWTIKIVLFCVIITIIGAYVLTAMYFGGHFYPGTIINGSAFDFADQAAAESGLAEQMDDYKLQIYGRDMQSFEQTKLCTVTGEEIAFSSYVEKAEIETLLKAQRNWLWVFTMWGKHDCRLQNTCVYDREKLETFLNAQDAFQEAKMTEPRDAYIEGYSEDTGNFVLVSEVTGSKLNVARATKAVEEALLKGQETVSLEETNCYINPSVTAGEGSLQERIDEAERWLDTRITYDWNGREVILSKEEIKDWIILKDGEFSLDKDAVKAFVSENADQYDTYGKNRVFHTYLGYDLTLPGGAFGWLTDKEAETEELITLIRAGTVGQREPVYASRGPMKGVNDIGNSYLEADMTHQHLYLYQNGEIVLESDFVSGDMNNGNATPQGVFGITYKTMNAVLRGRDYVTPVTYWMPFHGNYGLHDATWRDAFGGDIYLTNGSHGCLNLPLDKAGEIYQYMKEGFPIICYYYPPGVLPEPVEQVQEDYDDSED